MPKGYPPSQRFTASFLIMALVCFPASPARADLPDHSSQTRDQDLTEIGRPRDSSIFPGRDDPAFGDGIGLTSVPGGRLPPTRTRKPPSDGSIPRTPGDSTKITETPEDITLTPGGGPPTIYGEELDEEAVACYITGSTIPFPLTADYTEPPPDGQEAVNQPAMGARNVYLHDRSFTEVMTDMYVKAPGIDFELVRTYRSNIKTHEGGYMGYNWEFNYHKRLLPKGGVVLRDGLKGENVFTPGPVDYMDGSGRVDQYTPILTQVQTVQNYGHLFKAVVTYYRGPKGKLNMLQRYSVLPGYTPPPMFAGHRNWEGAMFYVMRYKDDFKEIYSCRGMLLYLKDRHQNTATLNYDEVFQPLTQNLRLAEFIDAADRKYEFKWKGINLGAINTNYKGIPVNGPEQMWRLEKVLDFAGREVNFEYQSEMSPVLARAVEKSGRTIETSYHQEMDEGRAYIKSISYPVSGTILANEWKKEGPLRRVKSQTFGGGSYSVSGNADKVTVGHPDGYQIEYKLARQWGRGGGGGEAQACGRTNALGTGEKAVTKYQYNDYDLPVRVEKPEGNTISYAYETADVPVSIAKSFFDWQERGVNWLFNLQGGNLKSVTRSAGKKKTSWTMTVLR